MRYIPQDHLRLSQDAQVALTCSVIILLLSRSLSLYLLSVQLNIEPSDFNEYFDLMENTINSEGVRQIKYRPKEWLMERYPEDD